MKIRAKDYKLEIVPEERESRLNTIEVMDSIAKIKNPLANVYKRLLRHSNASQTKIVKYKITHKPSGISVNFDCKPEENVREVMRKVIKTNLRTSIQNHRIERRKDKPVETIVTPNKSYYTIGGVFTERNTFIELPGELSDPNSQKKPISNKLNYLGVELEFNSNGNQNAEAEAMRTYFKKEKLSKYVCVSHDHCGHELKLLLPDENFKPILKRILDYLNGQGFKANNACGMHVHIDMRNRDVKLAYKNLYKMQEIFFALIPKERRTNKFCKKNTLVDFDDQLSNVGGDRYYTINTMSYSKHKTLEVRLHHGTLEYSLISNWLKLLVKTVNLKQEIRQQTFDNLETLKSDLKLRDYELKTIEKRIQAYA